MARLGNNRFLLKFASVRRCEASKQALGPEHSITMLVRGIKGRVWIAVLFHSQSITNRLIADTWHL